MDKYSKQAIFEGAYFGRNLLTILTIPFGRFIEGAFINILFQRKYELAGEILRFKSLCILLCDLSYGQVYHTGQYRK